jgi:tubulin monoglycylase TTLL15
MNSPDTHHYFEFVRFDFIMEENFKLYLMEINMSPNITPNSKRFEKNAIKREKMIFEAVNLIGAGNRFDLMTR